jgi:nucleoside-diphosphate-sugar epimerase
MRALEGLEVQRAPKGPAEQFIVYGEAMMRVLITGGAGFIGRRVMDNGGIGRLDPLVGGPKAGSVTLLRLDLSRPADGMSACQGTDDVVHPAAQISAVESSPWGSPRWA